MLDVKKVKALIDIAVARLIKIGLLVQPNVLFRGSSSVVAFGERSQLSGVPAVDLHTKNQRNVFVRLKGRAVFSRARDFIRLSSSE